MGSPDKPEKTLRPESCFQVQRTHDAPGGRIKYGPLEEFFKRLDRAFCKGETPKVLTLYRELGRNRVREGKRFDQCNRKERETILRWAYRKADTANKALERSGQATEQIRVVSTKTDAVFCKEKDIPSLQLPAHYHPSLIARLPQLRRIVEQFNQHKKKILITGPPGIGKTALLQDLKDWFHHDSRSGAVFYYQTDQRRSEKENETRLANSLYGFLSPTRTKRTKRKKSTNVSQRKKRGPKDPSRLLDQLSRVLLQPFRRTTKRKPKPIKYIIIDGCHRLETPDAPSRLIQLLLQIDPKKPIHLLLGSGTLPSSVRTDQTEDLAILSIIPSDPIQQSVIREFVRNELQDEPDELVNAVTAYSRGNFYPATHLINASIAQSDSQPIDEDFLEDQLVNFFRTRPDRIWPSSFPARSTSESIRRSGSVQEILAAIDQSDSPIHVLEAPPGFGKTELCRQLYWHLWKTSLVPLHFLDWSSTTFEQANHTLQALASNKNGQAWLVADNLERYFKSAEVFTLINHALQTTPLPHNFKIIIPTWTDALPLYLLNLEDLPRTSLSNLLTDQDEAITEFLTRFLRPPLLNDLPSILEFVAHNFTIAQATVRIARDMEYWPINTAEKANYDLHERFQAMLQRREYNTQESRASLHLLAIAEGPIPHRTFKGWMSDLERTIPDRTFHNPLTFCHPEPLRQDRLTPFHSLFRDFLKEDAKPYAADLHELIVRYYKNHPQTTQECEYRRRYLTHHLYEIGHLEEVLADLSDDHIQWYRRVYGDDANLQRLLNCGIAAANTLVKPDDSLRLWMHQQAITADLKAGPF